MFSQKKKKIDQFRYDIAINWFLVSYFKINKKIWLYFWIGFSVIDSTVTNQPQLCSVMSETRRWGGCFWNILGRDIRKKYVRCKTIKKMRIFDSLLWLNIGGGGRRYDAQKWVHKSNFTSISRISCLNCHMNAIFQCRRKKLRYAVIFHEKCPEAECFNFEFRPLLVIGSWK